MYWLALAAVLAMGVHSWGKPVFAPWAIIRSMLFVPYFAKSVNLLPFPVLVPGWTLNFEMLFYGLFAIGLLIGRPLLLTIATMGLLFVIGQLFRFTLAPLVLYTSWLSILFVAGLLIGARPPAHRLTPFLWPVGVPLIIAFPFLPLPHVALACGTVLLILGVTAWERFYGWPRIPALEVLGNASYAIYLVHIPVSFALWPVLEKLYSGDPPWLVYAPLLLGCSWIAGSLAHRFIEKPLGRRLRRAIQPAPTQAAAI